MTKQFDGTSTTEDVLDGIDLAGRRVLVTGVSAGLGVETARVLAAHGAQVIGTARDLEKAKRALAANTAPAAPGQIDLIELDLASLRSVHACSDALLADGRSFDVVINNAGVASAPFSRTEDGFEIQFGTNHLGHFAFSNRISPLIAPGGRLVVLGSSAHRFADIDLDDPNYDHTPYDTNLAYGRSKTATILFAIEFDSRHRDRGVRAVAVNPGVIPTELDRHMDAAALAAMFEGLNRERAMKGEPLFAYKTVPQGAATTIWAGFVADAQDVGGRYCENCHVAHVIEDPVDAVAEGLYAYAVDPERARLLWQKSVDLVDGR